MQHPVLRAGRSRHYVINSKITGGGRDKNKQWQSTCNGEVMGKLNDILFQEKKLRIFCFMGKVKDILFHGKSEKNFFFMGKVKDILFHGKI